MPEFILKDWHGKDQTFNNDTIFMQGTGGELIQFTQGAGAPEIKLQEKTITENGEYTADAGFDGLFKVLVDVAGSGGGSTKVAFGTFSTLAYGASKKQTITHNLGSIPDLIFAFPKSGFSSTSGTANYHMMLAMSDKFSELYASGLKQAVVYGTGNTISWVGTLPITTTTTSSGSVIMGEATETSFSFGYPTTTASQTFRWIAIAGLTE